MPIYSGPMFLKGNVIAAIDVETTGSQPGFHEVIQIGIQLLDARLNPIDKHFMQYIKPEHPERAEKKAMEVNGLDLNYLVNHAPDRWQVLDWLEEWWTSLELPMNRALCPLAQNWQYDAGFIKDTIGYKSFNHYFFWEVFDTHRIVTFLNHVAEMRGQPIPYQQTGLTALCQKLNIENERPHDALADARAQAKVYKKLLEMIVGREL